MDCVICKNSKFHKGKVTVTLENNGAIILVKDVPAHICDVCEHYFLDKDIAREVLKRGQESLSKGTELEVIRLRVA
jgi:YgiT-type zinc finger domain-containing protein